MKNKNKVKIPKSIIVGSTIWTRESVLNLVLTNDVQMLKMLLLLFERQTAFEKEYSTTTNLNNVGFNAVDGIVLGIAAKFVIKNGFNISENYKNFIRKRIKKYSRQMWEIVIEKNSK
jgi:predicted ABC-type sugar transport system permease subunit